MRLLRASLLAFPGLATAQIIPLYEFSEVLAQPLAGGHAIVEIAVQTGAPTTTTGWGLVHASGAYLLPTVQLLGDSFLQIHLGVSGIDNATNLYLPGFPGLGASDAIALYGPSNTLFDFVCWGGTTGPLAAAAVAAGRWPSTLASAATPSQPGATIANRAYTRTASNLTGPLAWYVDHTPTLGSANDPGITQNLGFGCPASPSGIGSVSVFDPGPWLGEVHVLPITGVPSYPGLAALTMGTSYVGPVPLDFLGLLGCTTATSIEVVHLLAVPQWSSTIWFTYLVPDVPQLTGAVYYAEAVVFDPQAANPMQAQVTNTVRMLVGSR